MESELGLDGHSDADVLTHAVIDALLGAAGLERHRRALPGHRRALARRRLDRAAARGRARSSPRAGFAVVNVDATILLERPKLGALRAEMRERLAGALGIDPARVNVKATTGEGDRLRRRGEGVGRSAVATLTAS